MHFPPDPCFECCPRPLILLPGGTATDLAMDLYPQRYEEEVWPDCFDAVDKSVWFCPSCNMSLCAQEDQRCPICGAELMPPGEDEEE